MPQCIHCKSEASEPEPPLAVALCDNCLDWEACCNIAEDRDNGSIYLWRVLQVAEELFGPERAVELGLHTEELVAIEDTL